MLVLPILTLLLVITSINGTDPNNDGGYLRELVIEEDLQDEVCGLIRLMDSALCVSVAEDNQNLILTSHCDEDRKIFCYNSKSRFINLQGDEQNCVTKESNMLRLIPCSSEESTLTRTWVFTIDGKIKKEPTTNNICWNQDNSNEGTILVDDDCDEKFDFQLTRDLGKMYKDQAINLNIDEIVVKIRRKADFDDQVNKEHRFQVVLNFFSGDKDRSIGQVNVQLKNINSGDQSITIVNWEENQSTMCSETGMELKKLHTGEADLILTADVFGSVRIWIKLDELENTMILICGAGFLDRSDRMVVQWINLANKDRNSADNLFTVQYEVRSRDKPSK